MESSEDHVLCADLSVCDSDSTCAVTSEFEDRVAPSLSFLSSEIKSSNNVKVKNEKYAKKQINGIVANHIEEFSKNVSPESQIDSNNLEDTIKKNCPVNQNMGFHSNVANYLYTETGHNSHVCDRDYDGDETPNLSHLSIHEDKNDVLDGIEYVVYESEHQMPDIMRLITKDLSEPYSIYTYRYFIHNWPKLCFLAMDNNKCVGAIVCKLDLHKKVVRRGYIAMLAVDKDYRRKKIGSHLVLKAIKAMITDDCDEVVLETEITNNGALRLYENLGFVRDKRLFRYYLNGVDALRLKLWLR